jgi:iron-sulfur cluster insertion protein
VPLNLAVTEAAAEHIKKIIADEGSAVHLRFFVQGGGCSGFSYGFTLDEEINDDDFQIDAHGIKILVDANSAQYVDGSTIDFKKSLFSSEFSITNPNSIAQCGCGSSFSV